jgi:tRNA A-37 threonylcarbamoyl transferase component Bud32
MQVCPQPPASRCRVLRVIREAELARPEVRLEDWDGQLVVVKDYSVRAARLKLQIGRFLVQREYAAHARLQGLQGVADAIPSANPHIFVRAYVPGDPAPEVPQRLTGEFFQRLRAVILAVHRRAVAHGDLKRLQNILVQPDGSPALVDFSAAIISGSNPLAALLLAYMQDDDLRAIAKLKARHAPHLLSDEDLTLLGQRSLCERAWRWVRAYPRHWIQSRSDAYSCRAGHAQDDDAL